MIDQDPEGPTVIDQDLERKSTTRMKKPTQRPRELDFNRCCHHLGLISLVCCFCLRGLCFIRKISLVWSLYFLSSWVFGFDFSLFIVFMFWVSLFDLSLFDLCGFLCFFACLLLYVFVFEVLISGLSFVELESHRLKFNVNFTKIEFVILELLQWTWVAIVNSILKCLRS